MAFVERAPPSCNTTTCDITGLVGKQQRYSLKETV